MENFKESPQSINAFCYLYKEGDSKNKCTLSDEYLTVTYQSRAYTFDLAHVVEAKFESRKLMFPLIIGGITSAFILLAILNNLFNPWAAIFILVGALAAFYIGWNGTNVLTVKEKGNNNDFMLKHVSINMKYFVNYLNKSLRIRNGSLPEAEIWIYHITNQDAWSEAAVKGVYSHESLASEGFIHASDRHQTLQTAELYYGHRTDLVLLVIDPKKLTSPLKYELSKERNMLFPHIFGTLNLEAVIASPTFVKGNSGKFSFPDLEFNQNS